MQGKACSYRFDHPARAKIAAEIMRFYGVVVTDLYGRWVRVGVGDVKDKSEFIARLYDYERRE